MSLYTESSITPKPNHGPVYDEPFYGFDPEGTADGLAVLWPAGTGTLIHIDASGDATDIRCDSIASAIEKLTTFADDEIEVGLRLGGLVSRDPLEGEEPDAILEHAMFGKRYVYMKSDARGEVACPGYDGWRLSEMGEAVTVVEDERVSAATSEDVLDLDIEFNVGPKAEAGAGAWKEESTKFGAFAKSLMNHREGAKDGRAFTQGRCLDGTRKAKAMESMYMLGVDMDSGQALEEVKAKIQAKGLACAGYTTHSHLKAKTEISKDKFNKWLEENPGLSYAEYLIDVHGIVEDIARGAEFSRDKQTINGFMIELKHAPIPKYRLIFPLHEPLIFTELGHEGLSHKEAIDRWKRVYAGFCNEMQFFYDRSVIDPSRLFYFPRCKKGSTTHESFYLEGKALNWREVPLATHVKGLDKGSDDPYVIAGNEEGGPGGGGHFEFEGVSLTAWAAAGGSEFFEIYDAIEKYSPDKLNEGWHIVCPFEHHHSSAGGTGTFVKNGSESDNGFVIHCTHNGCAGRDRLHFLQGMLEEGYFPLEALYEDDLVALHDDAPQPQPSDDELESKVAALAEGDDPTEVIALIAAAKFSAVKERQVIAAIEKATGHGKSAIKKDLGDAKKACARAKARADDGKPVISTGADFDDQTKAASAALLAHAERGRHLYRFNEQIARVARSEDTATYIQPLDVLALRYQIQNAARFESHTGEGVKGVAVPREVAEHLYQQPADAFPPLKAIVHTPVFASDGSLITAPGYHAPSRLYYDPPKGFEVPAIPEKPTPDDVTAAKALILDNLYHDFPFYGKDGGTASKAHALCLMLQPFVREMIDGPTPIYLIDKPAAGTGAGLFMNATTIVSTGYGAPTQTESSTEDERRKNITASLMDGALYYCLDNIKKPVDSAAYASATTAPIWQDRVLGRSDKVSLPIRCTWIFTGNNPSLSNELTRRAVRIRLDTGKVDPTARTDFKHDNLEGWAKANRAALVGACLTLVRAWIAAGCPSGSTGRLGSFEAWSDVMGGILGMIDVTGFLGNRAELRRDMGAEKGVEQEFITAWFEEHGTRPVSVREQLAELAKDVDGKCAYPELPITNHHDDKLNRHRFGHFLSNLNDRPFEIKGTKYHVEIVGDAGGSNKYQLKMRPNKS